MLENQPKKMLLLSDDPADVSFLSEIALTQHADVELVPTAADLCARIAEYRANDSLVAVFVDVTSPQQLRKFEFEFQSKMGSGLASELSSMVHFISGIPLAMNREILQSPYFSFYSERKSHHFAGAAQWYQQTYYRAEEYLSKQPLSFDHAQTGQFIEKLKKELITKGTSPEWFLKAKPGLEEMLEALFPSRFQVSLVSSPAGVRIAMESKGELQTDEFQSGKFLGLGMSAILSRRVLVLFIPIFEEALQTIDAFRFYKVEK